ncbi:MAG: hypothetical protein WCK37_01285 [Candidatus Falkowbacteria bacterium]
MKNKKAKLIWSHFAADVKNFFPFFAGFYLLSLLIAKFSITYKDFFYWPAFNGAALLLLLVYIATFNPWLKIKFKKPNLKINFSNLKLALENIFLFINKIFSNLKRFILLHWPTHPRWFFTRVIMIAGILIFSLMHNISFVDFLILGYALVAFLFVVDNRYAAGGALVCLAICPVLLLIKNDVLAEYFAVYAYYFLVITVLGAIIEMRLEKR